MSFHAQCTYCGQKARVPDHALGASGQCPKCANFFTLVPMEEALVSGTGSQRVLPSGSFSNAPPSASKTAHMFDQPAHVERAEPVPPKRVTGAVKVEIAQDINQPAKRPWIEPVGVVVLLLVGAALLCSLSYSLSRFVVALSLASLLLGLVDLLRVRALGTCRPVLPLAGALVGGLVCLVALVFPNFLGPTYLASRTKKPEDLTTVQVVPLDGAPNSGQDNPEWVDASRAALQQGRTYVQVLSASIGPLETRPLPNKKGPREGGPSEEFLVIRLRTRGLATVRETESTRDEKAGAKLTDNFGKLYLPRNVQKMAPQEKGRKSFPMGIADQLFVFEVPSPGWQYLRLELPAESWGGSGWFRFTVPSAMVRSNQASAEF